MFVIAPEAPTDSDAVETLLDLAFGPDRLAKASYRLRDGLPPVAGLCFCLWRGEALRASLRFWSVRLGEAGPGLLLGPLAVHPLEHGRGLGSALMQHGLRAAALAGHRAVVLVGDEPYYARFGFGATAAARLRLPGNPDQRRLLGLELVPGALAGAEGWIGRGDGRALVLPPPDAERAAAVS